MPNIKLHDQDREIELMEMLLKQKDETIRSLKNEIVNLETRLSQYETKTKAPQAFSHLKLHNP